MAVVYGFMADGSEEVELLAVVDVLMRGGVEVKLISVTGRLEVESAHHIRIKADALFEEVNCRDADVLLLPGGMPGTLHLGAHEGLCQALLEGMAGGQRLAAICAAPSILGQLGLLKGKRATCYPGFEEKLLGADYTSQGVVTDGSITTARGLGYALDLGVELLGILTDKTHAADIKKAIQYDQF